MKVDTEIDSDNQESPDAVKQDNSEKPSVRSKLLSFTSNFIAGMLVLSYAGYKLDEYSEREDHLYLLIGVFLGFAWSMYETFKLVRFINRNND